MGLRAALRQDPDVIMIGEMRDAETVDTAIKAAETGHLLMSTLHTPDAQSTILRIMAMFPPEEQNVIRIRLAESLSAIISQRLLPKISGKGRAVATEIMINTPAIKDPHSRGHAHRRDQGLHRRGARSVRHADVRPVPSGSGDERGSDVRDGEVGGKQPVGFRAQDDDVLAGLTGGQSVDYSI
jgi:Tfp pilus assembly ATPase PilU